MPPTATGLGPPAPTPTLPPQHFTAPDSTAHEWPLPPATSDRVAPAATAADDGRPVTCAVASATTAATSTPHHLNVDGRITRRRPRPENEMTSASVPRYIVTHRLVSHSFGAASTRPEAPAPGLRLFPSVKVPQTRPFFRSGAIGVTRFRAEEVPWGDALRRVWQWQRLLFSLWARPARSTP